jgi:hypothetical protein
MALGRVRPNGSPDPSFNGGAPLTLPFQWGFPMLVAADGTATLAGTPEGPQRTLVARYQLDGSPDPSFGAGGVADLGSGISVDRLLDGGEGRVLAFATRSSAFEETFIIRRPAADGSSAAPDVTLDGGFGGGFTSFLVSRRPQPLPPRTQDSFRSQLLAARPDGSFVIPGAVKVAQPTGEGAGFSIWQVGLLGLTPSFAVDPTYGTAPPRLRGSVRVERQRAHAAHDRRGVPVRLTASAVGTAPVTVRTGGRTIAQSVVLLFHVGAQVLPIELTRTGFTAAHAP